MNETIHEFYKEAGKIAAKVRKEAVSRVKVDIPLLEIAEYAENRTKELGGNIAFPCNISINEIASHFTPEDSVPCFKRGDVVKVDVGVHIEGYIADTAETTEIGTNEHHMLIMASEEALLNAISSVRNKMLTGSIGKVIEKTIKNFGFHPVVALTGHSLEQYKLHAGITIPNYGSLLSQKINTDMVFAIEPFATYGKGGIKYGKAHIFAANAQIKSKTNHELRCRFGDLPFARRWLNDWNIEELNGLKEYRELIESTNKIVTQSEHTVIVNEDGCEVLTK
ncbi:MAG: type II methionyl aminopeptidase [Candidatus Methanoperedens sp.]|nr:type II methionyl aminopeptidase [Candidatus Methanoperedens sp.]MCE8424955.1 type II methionyl aminopeptidase [Candidatus Methanoperedens sp.]MCE8427441.1 type II methionyl aminopeptidase [Candidatus Methanoperedens sp.]